MRDITNMDEFDKKAEEVLDIAALVAAEKNMKELPEAPASANVRVKTPSGHQWQITMRTNTVNDLFRQIEIVEGLFEAKGWIVPAWQDEGKQSQKGPKCPDCGEGELRKLEVKKEGPNLGRKFEGCTNKDCKHFVWLS